MHNLEKKLYFLKESKRSSKRFMATTWFLTVDLKKAMGTVA